MTKLRQPMSFEGALMRIAARLGYDGCASVLGVSESFVRKLSDPDIEREISIQKARRLDQAYIRAGGEGAPFLECYSLQIEVEAREEQACAARLLDTAGACARETGEAVSAIVAAIGNLDCGKKQGAALREIEEAISSLKSAAGNIRASSKRKAGK